MTKRIWTAKLAGSMAVAAVLLAGAPAAGLDGYQDRRGLFTGLGIGGGVALSDGDAGGEVLFELVLGGGATEQLTLALDIDVRYQRLDADRQNWMVVPGPEASYFLSNGLFVRAGVGLAMVFVQGQEITDVATPGKAVKDKDFTFGFDGSLGLGWEFFVNSNLALGLAVEADYFLIDGHPDVFVIGLSMGMRYY